MKTLSLPRYSSNTLLNKVLHFQPGIGLLKLARLADVKRGKIGGEKSDSNKHAVLKTAGQYLSDALGESFRQNFLGYDINIEFIWLTMQRYGAYFSVSRFSSSRKETQTLTQISTKHNEN